MSLPSQNRADRIVVVSCFQRPEIKFADMDRKFLVTASAFATLKVSEVRA